MPKILIVDDEPANRYLMVSVLRYDGHDVLEASGGAVGLELAREHKPDLIIIDLSMPEMSGAAFMKHLRADDDLGQTRVALYTGTSIDAALRDFMEMMRIAHIIPKPSEPLDVIRIVREALL